MKGLLTKDILLNFGNRRTIITYILLSVFMSFSMDSSFIVGYTGMLLGILGIGTIAYDEMDNGFPFLMSLPVDHKTYVKEKFLYSFLMECLGALSGLIISVVVSLIKGGDPIKLSDLSFVAGTVFALYMMICIMIPIQLKYGSERSRLVMFVLYGIVFSLAIIFRQLQGAESFLQGLVMRMDAAPAWLVASILFALCAAIVCLCYRISLKVMKDKEY